MRGIILAIDGDISIYGGLLSDSVDGVGDPCFSTPILLRVRVKRGATEKSTYDNIGLPNFQQLYIRY